jgi:hypothetical protein
MIYGLYPNISQLVSWLRTTMVIIYSHQSLSRIPQVKPQVQPFHHMPGTRMFGWYLGGFPKSCGYPQSSSHFCLVCLFHSKSFNTKQQLWLGYGL